MLKILCSEKNLPEKNYIFDIVFNEFLGIEYELIIKPEEKNYIIELENHHRIILKDYFWNQIKGDALSYLNQNFLPTSVKYSKNPYTYEEDFPVLYGDPEVKKEGDTITSSIDIFAIIYFFLSRWEEYISDERDFAGRFKYENSISAKFNLLRRPVVNEAIEFLWNMLLSIGYTGSRKVYKFRPIISHDIDQPIRLSSFKMLIKASGKTIIKHRNFPDAMYYSIIYPINKITPRYDLANSYEFLMDASDSIGVQSYFNFQSSIKTNYDWGYNVDSRFIKNILKKIKSRDHIIGFHPGFYTIDDQVLWKEQYDKLCGIAEMKIRHGRQHYLRFRAPYTWQYWEDNGMETDSTLGYAEKEGFRCGTCYEYSVYNFLTRKKLKLKETPLLVMDVTLMGYQNYTNKNIFFDAFNSIVNTVKKYKGDFVFLWHNSAFDRSIYTKDFYSQLISVLSN